MNMVDNQGYRFNVGIILVNAKGQVFLGKRQGIDAWQFPQGGIHKGESMTEAVYRELREELGLDPTDVTILGSTQRWLKYELPKQYVRMESKPVVFGQKQRWYLLQLQSCDQKVCLDSSQRPEFDSWRWAPYWEPLEYVIFFKRKVYERALHELAPILAQKIDPSE